MKMAFGNSVYVFGIAVTCSAHIAYNIACRNRIALLEVLGIGAVLPQMRIVPISFVVKRAYADSPTAVSVPAEALDLARFNGYNGSTDCRHQVVPQMRSCVSECPLCAKVIVMRIRKGFCNRRKPPQSVVLLYTAVRLLLLKVADHTAEHRRIYIIIVCIVFHILGKLGYCFAVFQLFAEVIHIALLVF